MSTVPTRIPMPLSESRDFTCRIDPELLKRLARKYVWWKTVDEALAAPERIIAQTMNMGDYADVQALAAQASDDALKRVLVNAEAGQFDDRSWVYWHYRLGLADVDQVAVRDLPQVSVLTRQLTMSSDGPLRV
jgi:hypothetical protein